MVKPVLLAMLLAYAQKTEAAEPTVESLVAGLEKTEAAIENLTVKTEYVKLQKFSLPVKEPVKMPLTTKFIVDRDGRSVYECTGEQVNVGPKPDEVKTYRGRWLGAYDGEVATSLTGGADGRWHSGAIDRYPSWHGVNPLEYTTHYFSKPVRVLLKEKGATIAGQATSDGRDVKLVDTTPVINNGGWKYRFWIDPERRVVVRRAALKQESADQPWREYTRIESRGHKEIQPGIWLPTSFKYESVELGKDGAADELSWSFEGTNSDWQVNRELSPKIFRIEFPQGVVVNDHRQPPEKPAEK